MNASNAKDFLPLVKALAEGKTIQVSVGTSGVWHDEAHPLFDAEHSFYRIKPEPRERWMNIYDDMPGTAGFKTKEEADRLAFGPVKECVRVREVL